jgi:hypothetical protein
MSQRKSKPAARETSSTFDLDQFFGPATPIGCGARLATRINRPCGALVSHLNLASDWSGSGFAAMPQDGAAAVSAARPVQLAVGS